MLSQLGEVAFAGSAGATSDAPGTSAKKIVYRSFVNEHYRWRRDLHAWKNTAEAIKATLEKGYSNAAKIGKEINDGTPESLRTFFDRSPKSKTEFVINYIASVRLNDGTWVFSEGGRASSGSILSSGEVGRDNLRTICIIDTCSAASGRSRDQQEGGQTFTLFASKPGELTHALNFTKKQPLNLKKKYPKVYRWLSENMPSGWDGTLSFVGFVWVKVFLGVDGLPQTAADWRAFFTSCQTQATKFADEHSTDFASTITVEFNQ